MLTFVTPRARPARAASALLALLSSFAGGEVVHMKNGDVVYADRVSETATSVQYEIGDNSFTVPKSRVERIETGVPSVRRPSDLPAYLPSAPAAGEAELLGQVVREGSVNQEALDQIQARGNDAVTAVAYYIAGKQEFQQGKYPEARRHFEAGLRYDPENPAIANFYAALLLRTGSPRDAVEYARRAVKLAPDSPDALVVLGYAQYGIGHSRDAVQAWKQSLALRPDASVQQLIDRVGRELATEGSYSERETGHFTLRYEGAQSSEAFRAQILATLEAAYSELARDFGTDPRSSLQVILYTNQAFFDVTHAPSWMGALNDGKIRIPLQGLDSVTPELARILKHELTHSFVNQLSMGRCPQWLNEGIAQVMEPRTLGSRGARLAEMFRDEHAIPFYALERSFGSFSGNEAMLAYDESLAAADYIRSSSGMSDLVRLLKRIGQGESPESALRSTLHSDYRQLQNEVGTFLTRQFTN